MSYDDAPHTRITTPAALDAWLDDRVGFEDGHLAGIESGPGRVTLRLEEYVEQGWRPGDVAVVDVWELVAENPAEFVAPPTARPDHVLVEGVHAGDVDGRLLVEAWVPEPLRLVAEALSVTRLRREERVVDAWVSDTVFTAMSRTRPPAAFWTAGVTACLGEPVVWRILGGRTPRPDDVEYDGAFLQRQDSLATTDGGVLCLWERAGMTFRWGEADTPLWDAIRRTATDLDGVQTGNCFFRPADWHTYVTTSLLPPPNRL
jgi:hypothetical protein